jgi:hypothetical protein
MKICFAFSRGLVATRGLIVSFVTLALAAFLVGNHSRNSRLQDETEAQRLVPAAVVHSRDRLDYFKSGRWKADLRTLMAVCRVLVDPDLA